MDIVRPSFKYQVGVTLLSVMMALALVQSLSDFWHMGSSSLQLMTFTLLAGLFAWLSWRYPKLTVVLLITGVGVALGAARYLPAWADYLRKLHFEGSEFWAQISRFELEASFDLALGQLFLLFAAVAACYLILHETLTTGRAFWSITGGTIVFGTEWAWFNDKSATYFSYFLVLGFAVWTVGQAGRRDALWESAGRKIAYRSRVAAPLAGLMAVSLLATILPTRLEPIDLGALGDRALEAFPVLRQMRGGLGGSGGRFRLLSTGFSPNLGSLGGPVKLDNTVALQLQTPKALSNTAYLRGVVLREYNGKTWLASNEPPRPVPGASTIPTEYASDVLLDVINFKVTHSVNLGETIFSQLEPARAEGLKNPYRTDNDNVLTSERAIVRGTPYVITTRQPRYSAQQIRQLSTTKPSAAYGDYIKTSPTVTGRVKTLARRLTDGIPHPFDKAVALESYLRGMKYDLNTPAPPANQDFVDFFLFDLQRGYCTYYATAMAVMLRDLGIPSRFVEGFAVPTTAATTQGKDGKFTYAVLNSQAHAWVEAYFPGYGWVTFDPTPRADIPSIDRSTLAPNNTDDPTSTTGGGTTGPDPNEQPKNDPRDKNLLPEDENLGTGGSAGAGSASTGKWPWAVGGVAALLAMAALVITRRLRSLERLTGSESRQLVQEAWVKTDSLMGAFDFGRKANQTPLEYAQALGRTWPGLREPATQVASDYTVARFGPPDRPLDEEASSRAKSLWSRVHELLLERYGWRLYFWRRLRWSRKAKD